jgi:glycosyltransferase involved in cell wall biosynthesis
MRFLLINPNAGHDYDVDTPAARPLAGSESAQVYLALALAQQGHEVHVVTGTTTPGLKQGVHCHALTEPLPAPEGADAILVTSAPRYALEMRAFVGPRPRILAWEHNVWDSQPAYGGALQALAQAGETILCVSDWHRQHFIDAGSLPPTAVRVLRNAVAPAFLTLFTPSESIVAAKTQPPRLAFTAAPYKGLEAALAIWPAIHQLCPDATLDLYSNFDLYPPNSVFHADPRWRALTRRAQQTAGACDQPLQAQPALAAKLRATAALYYPNTAPETSSIAVMEAMAAGCMIIAPAFGALRETAGQFLLPPPMNAAGRFTLGTFAQHVASALASLPSAEAYLRDQVDHVTATMRWDLRARELLALLSF